MWKIIKYIEREKSYKDERRMKKWRNTKRM
jgi:hypothetical protein